MGLTKQDIVIVYESAPKQVIGFWFRIKRAESLPVEQMWDKYQSILGIDKESYFAYFEGCTEAIGFHIGRCSQLHPAIPLNKVKEIVPDFVPPQGLIWVRDNVLRFKELICAICPPLPTSAFRQFCLFDSLSS